MIHGNAPQNTQLRPSLLVGVRASFGAALDNADETAVVHEPFLGATSEFFLLLGLRNLWCLILHFTSTCQGAVNLAHGFEWTEAPVLQKPEGEPLVKCLEPKCLRTVFHLEWLGLSLY